MGFYSPSLRNAIRTMRRTVKKVAAVRIDYTQGSTTYEGVLATLDATSADEDVDGLIYREVLRDFKIDVADLAVRPQRLDLIAWEIRDGVTEYYQVLGTAGVKEVESLGNFNLAWRIHTKQIPAPLTETFAYALGDGTDFVYGPPTADISYGSADE